MSSGQSAEISSSRSKSDAPLSSPPASSSRRSTSCLGSDSRSAPPSRPRSTDRRPRFRGIRSQPVPDRSVPADPGTASAEFPSTESCAEPASSAGSSSSVGRCLRCMVRSRGVGQGVKARKSKLEIRNKPEARKSRSEARNKFQARILKSSIESTPSEISDF